MERAPPPRRRLPAYLLLLAFLAAATAAAPPSPILPPAAPIAPAWSDLAQLAADATLAALAADGRLDGLDGMGADDTNNPATATPRYALEAVHPGSARLTTGQEQAVTLEIDGVSYRLLLHDQDARRVGEGEGLSLASGPDPAAVKAAARAVAAAAAATAAAAFPGRPGSPGDGWAATGAWPPAVAAGDADFFGEEAQHAATPPSIFTPGTAPAPPPLALPPFTLAGPLELVLVGGGVESLALHLPHPVELASPPARVLLPAGVAVRVVGAVRAGLASSLSLGAPPPAWTAAAYGVRVAGVEPPAPGALAPGAGILAATAGARADAEAAGAAGAARPALEVVFGEGSGCALEAAPHPDAAGPSPPMPLRVRQVGPGAVELVPRVPEGGQQREGERQHQPPPVLPARARGGPSAWAWPLPGARGATLARFDAALMELVAVARATRAALAAAGRGGGGGAPDGGQGGDPTTPTLRLGAASSEAVSFVRVRLALRRLGGGPPDPDAVAAAGALGGGDPAVEHWEALVRVAPPAAPGGPPRVAALRADRLGAGGVGAPRSLTVSPLAEAALRGNATLPGDGDLAFVYPVPGIAYGGGVPARARAVARA